MTESAARRRRRRATGHRSSCRRYPVKLTCRTLDAQSLTRDTDSRARPGWRPTARQLASCKKPQAASLSDLARARATGLPRRRTVSDSAAEPSRGGCDAGAMLAARAPEPAGRGGNLGPRPLRPYPQPGALGRYCDRLAMILMMPRSDESDRATRGGDNGPRVGPGPARVAPRRRRCPAPGPGYGAAGASGIT